MKTLKPVDKGSPSEIAQTENEQQFHDTSVSSRGLQEILEIFAS